MAAEQLLIYVGMNGIAFQTKGNIPVNKQNCINYNATTVHQFSHILFPCHLEQLTQIRITVELRSG